MAARGKTETQSDFVSKFLFNKFSVVTISIGDLFQQWRYFFKDSLLQTNLNLNFFIFNQQNMTVEESQKKIVCVEGKIYIKFSSTYGPSNSHEMDANGIYCIPFFMSMVFKMMNFHTERKKSFHKHFNNKGCNTKVKNFIFFTCRKQKRKSKDLTWISEKEAFFWTEPDIVRASNPVAAQI